MRTILLQDWVTVQGNIPSSLGGYKPYITQTQNGWLDVSSFSAATFWIDVTSVVVPGSSTAVTLSLQTSPTLDESYFTAAAPILNPLIQANNQVVQTVRAPGLSPLARYLRWQLAPSNIDTEGTWGATFRIRVAPSLESFFVPTDLGGCVLWLRGDLGITQSGGAVSAWADQSGNGHNALQSNTNYQPAFYANEMNGLPCIKGNGSTDWMQTAAFTLQPSATLFAAAQPTTVPQDGYARLIEQQYNESYYLGTDTTGDYYQFFVNDNTAPYGTAIGGTVATGANTIIAGNYSSTSSTGTLFVNGAAVASGTFTAPSATNLPVTIMQDYGNLYANYWAGYFAEAIIYNRSLSSREMARVNRYLAGRYGVTM